MFIDNQGHDVRFDAEGTREFGTVSIVQYVRDDDG